MGECTRSKKAKNTFASEPHLHEAGRAGLLLAVALALLAACRTPEPATPRTDRFEAEAKTPRRTESFEAKPKADPGSGGPNAEVAFVPSPTAAAPLAGELEVHFIKVGQGDSTLLKLPNGTTILVDGGSLKEKKPKDLKDYLEAELDDDTIDTLVITHPDADHYNLLPYAISGLTVGQVLYVGEPADYSAAAHVTTASSAKSNGFRDWLNALPAAKRKILTEADMDDQGSPSNTLFNSGEVDIHIVAADVRDGTDKNSRSIVLLVTHGDFDLLLTGDATFATETSIMGRYDDWWLDVDCLKLGHHGSRWTSSSPAWINATQPEIAVASAAYTKAHGHPSHTIRARVEAMTVSAGAHRIKWWESKETGYLVNQSQEAIYSTATNGTIVVTTDGGGFDVSYSSN